jgi:hypothetical protein
MNNYLSVTGNAASKKRLPKRLRQAPAESILKIENPA